MSDRVKPWHSAHRRPKRKGKRPRHKHVLDYHREREEFPDSIWLTVPPTKDELADGTEQEPF